MKNKSVSAKKNTTTSRAVRALRYCAVPFAALFGVSASAATIIWDGVDGDWGTAANWSTAPGATTPNPAAAPGAADAALFNITGVNGNESVTLAANQSAGSLTFNNTGTTTIKSDSTTLRYLTLGSGGITIGATAGAVTIGDATNLTSLWLAYGQTWTNNSGSLFTVVNPIYNGAATLTVGGSGNTTISGAIAGTFSGAGSGGVTKTGAGTLTLGGNNNFTGAVSVTGGTMLINGTNAWTGASTVDNGATLQFSGASGTNTGASAYTLKLGGSMIVDNTTAAGGNNNARIADGSAFTLNGGSLIYKGADAAATNSTETIGALSGIGNSTITVTFGGTNVATLTAGAFTHAAGNATHLVNGLNLGMDSTSTASVARFISSTPTLVGTTAALTSGINSAVKNTQIVPFLLGEATSSTGGLGTASGTANTFVTYVAGSGYRPLNLTDEFTANAITAGHNIWLNTGTTPTNTAAINSLVMGGGTLNINDGQTLTNTSGAILFSTTSAINPTGTTGAFAFAAVEPQITVNSSVTGTISTNITGSAGLTKSGAGTLLLSGSVANAYTGTTTVNAGTLQLGKSGAVQALSGALTIGSTLTSLAPVVQYTGASSDMMGTGAVTINSAGQLDFNGKTDTIGAVTINATGATGNTTNIANTAGLGNLTVGSTGTVLTITPAAGFTSRIDTGTGTLTLGGNVTFTAATTGQARISGNVSWGGNRTFNVGAGTGADYDMLVDATIAGGAFQLIKSGTGVLKLSSASNSYTGMVLNDGTIRLGATGALPTTTLTIGAGGTSGNLDLNGFNASVGQIYYASSSGSSALTTGLGTLTVTGTSQANGGNINGDSGAAMSKLISGKVNLAPTGSSTTPNVITIGNNGSGAFTVSATISGGALEQVQGTILFSGPNTHSSTKLSGGGVFQVGAASAGLANAPSSGPLGTGTVTFNNGVISSDGTTARTILNPVAFTAATGATFGNATNNGTLTFAGGMDLNTNGHTVTVNSAALITGTITGSGTITKAGAGTLTITPTTSNNYTGSLIAAAGILRAGATDAFSTTGDIGVSGSGTVDLNGFDVTVNNIRFITNAAGETSSIVTGSNTLTLNGGMNQFDSSAPGSRLISGKLKLGVGNHAISGAGGAALTISALISGTDVTSALSNSSQIVILTNANTYQGGTNVNGGTFRVGISSTGTAPSVTNGAFGTGTLTLTSGTVSSDGTTARTVGNAITFAGGITIGDATNTGKLTFGAGVNLGANTRTLTLNSDAEFSGIISNGGLTKAGTGTLTLSGNNIYTTLTTVSAGRLILTGNNASATGGMTLSGGVTQFNSVDSINGTIQNVTVTGPGAIVFGSAFETGTDIPTALASRIVASSTGAIATDNYSSTNFDFSTAGLTAASLGAVGNVTYTGTLTPNGTTYRLGGGGGTLTFTPGGGTFDNTQALVIGGNSNTGTVDFGGLSKTFGAITFAGGTATNGTLTGTSYSGTGGTVLASLSGSGAFTATSGTTTLNGNSSGYSGAIGINASATLKAVSSGSLGTSIVTINNTGILALTSDGTGTGLGNGKLENINYGNAVVLSGAAQTITLGQLTAPAGTNTLNAVNKTLQLGTLATGATTLTVTNSNKFGLEFTGTTTLSGTAAAGTTFSVGTANASTEVFGLTLNGLASDVTTSAVNDAVILTKSGAGTLLLKGTNSTFGGTSGATGQIINITDGYLAAGTDAALGVTGATGNLVQISANNAAKGFLATGTFSTDRTFKLNAAANGLDVTQGNTLTLTTPFALSAVTNGLQKNDIGTLELSNNNSTMTTGNFVVSQGVLKISNANAVGAAGTTTNSFTQVAASTHAAIQLNGTSGSPLSIGEYFKIAGYGMNNGGAIQAVGGGTSTITGSLDLTADGSLGAATGSTLTLSTTSVFPVSGAPAGGSSANIVGGGTVNLLSTIGANTNGLAFYGTGTGNFNFNAASQFNRALSVNGGYTVNLLGSNAFKQTGAGLNTGFTVNGSTVVFDNVTGAAVANRLGGATGSVPNLSRATLTLTGGGAVGEALGALTLGSGLTTLNTSGSNAGNILSFLSQAARNGGAVVNVNSTGNSSVRFATTSPALTPVNTGILNGWFVGSEFATHGGNNTAIAAFTGYTNGDLGAVGTTTATVKPSGTQTTVTTRTINALNLTSTIGVTIGSGQILTLTAGGLINDGGGDITGGSLTPGAELIAKYVTDGSISSSITSAQSLTKLGAGKLTLSAVPQSQFVVTSAQNTYTGTTTINEGILALTGGNNTLNVNRTMVLNGGTLALGSNNQYVGSFTSNTTAALGYGGSGGNVSGTGTLTTNGANGTFAGNLGWDGAAATALNFVKAGSNTLTLTNSNSTTGAISVIGGGLTLRDDGSLLGIASLAIRNATLTLDNGSNVNASKDVADRVKNTAAITMDGGLITYQGRVGFNSAESLGAVTVNSGQASFSAIQGATGVNSAQLTLASLTRSTGAVVNLQRLNPTNTSNLGLIGSTPRIVVTDGQTTVGGIVPGVFFAERDFVGYAPGLGFGRLGTVGFPAYYTTSASVSLASSPSTGNVKLAVSGAVASGGQTINALNADVYDVTFAGANDVLTLTSGMYTNMQSHSIGTTAVRGVLTSGSSELFLNAWHNSGSGVTVHSKITGTNMLVMSSDGNGGNPPFRLTNSANDYTGGTVVNSGLGITSILTLDNAVSAVYVPNATVPANGLVLNNSQAIMSVSQGQIGSSNIVTLNGASTLTMFGNNSLAGLVINSNGGTGVPTVNPGGSLTLTGDITSTPSNVAVTPVIGVAANGGNLNFGGVTRTVTVNAYTEGTYTNGAALVGLNIVAPIQNGGLTKTGSGILQLSATVTPQYSGTTTITTGAIQATTGTAFSPFSPVSLANTAGVLLDLNSQANTIGSLTGGGTTGGNVAVLGTTALTLGGDNTSPTAFLGNIIGNGAGTLTKIGSGTQILAGTNTITGLITVRNGTLQIGNALVGSLNGTTGNALTFNGTGTFNVSEASGVSQGMGALNFTAGNGTVQSTNNGGNSFLTFTSRARSAGGTANFVVTNGTNGTENKIVLTGTTANTFIDQGTFFQGGAYAWYDTASYVRGIQYTGSPDTGTATSSGAASLANATHQQITGSITAQNTATFTTFNISGNSDVTLASGQTMTLNGLLKTGNNAATISGGLGLTTAAEFVVSTNEASDALTISTPILGGNALTKTGAGTLTLSAPNTYTGTTTINQGTLALRGGMNALVVNTAMVVQNGGTLDLGGNSQYVGALTSAGTFEGNGGTITGTGGTFTTNGSSTTFAGNFTGSVSLTKAGTGTMTLSSASDTTGTINIIGTGLTLRDGGAFTGSTGVNVKSSTFTIDNTGTKNMTDRVNNAAPITLDDGNVFFNGRAAFNSTETLGAVTASSGVSSISATIGTGGSAELTLTSLTRSTGAELWFNRGNSTSLGLVGNNPRIIVTGGPTGNLAPINGVVPGAFTNANGDNYHMVGYVPGLGFGAFGTTGFPTYYSGLAGATSTSNVSGGGAVNAGGQTINSLGGSAQANVTFANATDLLTINSGMTVMQVTTWGTTALRGKVTSGTQELFIMHRDGNTTPDPIVHSVIADKGPNPSDKVSLIVHTPRQDRGYYVHLTAANTYSGGTFVNGGVSGAGGISLDATTDGTVVIPAGGLTINNNGLVEVTGFQGQIDSSNVVTINGGGQLNLMGTNTLAGIVFNSNGGTTQPKVTPYNTITAGSSNALATYGVKTGTLFITGNITSNPSNVAVTPLIDGGILDFNASTNHTITVDQLYTNPAATPAALPSVVGLNISAVIQGIGAGFTKQGVGYLQLSGANTYTGGTTVSAGTLVAQAANNLPTTGNLTVNSGGSFSMVNSAAVTTYVTAALNLAARSNLTFDWAGGSVDKLTSTAAATAPSGNVGISINPTASPSGTGLQLLAAPSGLTSSGTNYFLANNTNYTATLTQSDTSVTIGSYAAAAPLTSAYWIGGQVTNALSAMAFSSGTASNWAKDTAGTTAGGVVPGLAANVYFSTTSGATEQSNVVLGNSMTVNSLTFSDTTPVTIGADGSYLTLYSSGTGTSSAISANQTAVINAKVVLGSNQTWTVASTKTLTVGGDVSGTSGLTKDGTGKLILSGTDTYNGATIVNAGTLLVSGSISGSAVTVKSGGTLGTQSGTGGGTTGSVSVLSGGTLAPGASTGLMTVNGNLTIASGGIFAAEVNTVATPGSPVAGTEYDRVSVAGTVNLTASTLSLSGTYAGANGSDTFYLILNDGTDAVTGTFSGLAEGASVNIGAQYFNITYTANGDLGSIGNDVALTAVPEPGAAVSLLGGLGLLLGIRRRRRA